MSFGSRGVSSFTSCIAQSSSIFCVSSGNEKPIFKTSRHVESRRVAKSIKSVVVSQFIPFYGFLLFKHLSHQLAIDARNS